MKASNNMENNQESQFLDLENKKKERHGILGVFYMLKGIFGIVLGAIPLILLVMAFTGKFDEPVEEMFPGTFSNDQHFIEINTDTKQQEDVLDEISSEKYIEESDGESVVVDDYTLDAVPVGSKDYDRYLHYGGVYSSTDKSYEVTVIDISCRAYEINGSISKNIFIVFDIVNNGTSDLYFNQDDAILFIDDYEVNKGTGAKVAADNGYVMAPGSIPYNTSVAIRTGGRKGTIAFTCAVDGDMITEKSNIEFEILGLSYKINPLYILNLRTDDFDIRDTAVEDLDDPFAGTELEGMVPTQAKVGTYASNDSDTVIILDWRGFSVMFSDGYDCECISYRGAGTVKYPKCEFDIEGETCSVMFFGDSILVEGPIGGWYELIGDERYYSDEERGME